MSDLFGNADRLETAEASATAVDLFTATAERIAYEGGRNVAQARAELVFGAPSPAGGIFRPAKGDVVTAQRCDSCDAIFAAKPRTPAVCNLCRAKVAG